MMRNDEHTWDCYLPLGSEGDLPDDDFALIEEYEEHDPLIGLTIKKTRRAFPIFDAAHARAALKVCGQAEYYEKVKGWTVFPNREQRYQVRKAVWDRYRIPPAYLDKESEIQVNEE